MNTYFHPLDYAVGLKHYLTRDKVEATYRLSSETFFVEELVDFNKLGLNNEDGEYVVLKIVKRNIDTFSVLSDLSSKYGLPVENILYMGLKDRNSTSTQFFFIKSALVDRFGDLEISGKNYETINYGYVLKKPRRRDLVGNRFKIILRDVNYKVYDMMRSILKKIVENGLPSYYGYQRFGVTRFNTHLLGKYILIRRLDLFADELLKSIYPGEDLAIIQRRFRGDYGGSMVYEKILYRSRDPFRAISRLRRMLNELYVDAYGSYLYNLLLNNVIDRSGWIGLDNNYPLIGCRDSLTYYRDIMLNEGIGEAMTGLFKCWYRYGLFKPINPVIDYQNRDVVLEFTLSRGLYASIVLRELFKDNLVLK